MKRPDGITLISIYHWIVAATILVGLMVLVLLAVVVPVATFSSGDADARVAGWITVVLLVAGGVLLAVFGVVNLLVGLGLWNFRPWARIAALVLAALRLFNFPLGTAIGGLTIWYLLKPEVEPLFKR
jgi:hypothetical protein